MLHLVCRHCYHQDREYFYLDSFIIPSFMCADHFSSSEDNLFGSGNDCHRWLHYVCHHCLPTLTHYLLLFNLSASQEVGWPLGPHYSGFLVHWLPAGFSSRDTSPRRRGREDGRRGMFDNLSSCAFLWYSYSHVSNVDYLSWLKFFSSESMLLQALGNWFISAWGMTTASWSLLFIGISPFPPVSAL